MISEADIAAAVVQYLTDLQWEVYQEVQLHTGGNCADIVATQGPIVWVIEAKKSLTFEVIAQAASWYRYAHRTSVAVPTTRRFSKGRSLAVETLEWQGVGYLPVRCRLQSAEVVEHGVVRAPTSRHADAATLRSRLEPEHKTYAVAGNSHGRRWSPFQRTCKLILEHVEANPGTTLKAAVSAVDHHYATPASARGSLAQWIRAGSVPGVRLEQQGRMLCVYPAEVTG